MSRILISGSQYRTHDGRLLRPASEDQRRRKAMKRQAKSERHLLPQANKYRVTAFSELHTAHRYLACYRKDKARIALIESNGPRHVADRSFQSVVRRAGGAAAYLNDLLSSARYYLSWAARFDHLSGGAVLP